MAAKELNVFPQVTYSDTQGVLGICAWQLDASVNIEKFCHYVSRSHWPNRPDAIPVQVQSGPFDNNTVIDCTGTMTEETMGPLPRYGAAKVIAHYALQRMSNCWPVKSLSRGIPKARRFR